MKRIAKCTIVALTLVSLAAPQSIKAEPPRRISGRVSANTERVVDVALQDRGALMGMLVNAQSVPVADSEVVIRWQGELIAKIKTNAEGRFVAAGLRGGSYEIVSERGSAIVRAWAPGTAPPNAHQAILVVAKDQVVRGQFDGDTGSSSPSGITGNTDLDAIIIGAGLGLGVWGIVELASSS